MCPAEGSYASEQVPYPSHSGDWERTAEVVPESNAEMINDKQKNGTVIFKCTYMMIICIGKRCIRI